MPLDGWPAAATQNKVSAYEPYPASPMAKELKEGEKKPPQAEILLALVTEENCLLFHDEFQIPHARIRVGDHWEIWPIKSESFGLWLRKLFWDAEDKAIYGEAYKKVQSTLEARARFDGRMIPLSIRAAFYDGAIYYDLCDGRWRVIKITEQGWEIVEEPPILFKRYKQQLPLTLPSRTGHLKGLLPFINAQHDDQRILVVIYVVSCFIPGFPHPLLNIFGEQGSRKSTLSRMLRRIIDPVRPPLLSLTKHPAELSQQLQHHYFPFFDNVDYISNEISDALCRAVTGGGDAKRQLFTDDEDIIFEYKRAVGMNGINLVARKADLLDRTIPLELRPTTAQERKTEEEIWADFEPLLPAILGGIFDAVSGAMRLRSSITLQAKPRMADFAMWGCAIAEATGFGQEIFLRAYNASIALQNEEAINASGLATTILMFMEGREDWKGSPTELLNDLEGIGMLEKVDMKSRMWPKGAQALLRRLKEIQNNLLKVGIKASYGLGSNGRRFIELSKIQSTIPLIATDPSDAKAPKSILQELIEAGTERSCDSCDNFPNQNGL